jgi:hypothetical protein
MSFASDPAKKRSQPGKKSTEENQSRQSVLVRLSSRFWGFDLMQQDGEASVNVGRLSASAGFVSTYFFRL